MDADREKLAADKRALRLAIKAHFVTFDPTQRRRETTILSREVEQLDRYLSARTLLLYVGHLPEELPTLELIEYALDRGQRVACPRVRSRLLPLELHEVRNPQADLVPGVLGIHEPRADAHLVDPIEIDWALIPGLAFDAHGGRLGRGAGHYDRLLPLLRPKIPRWAAAYSIQLVDLVPTGMHDQPLTGVLGPSGVLIGDA